MKASAVKEVLSAKFGQKENNHIVKLLNQIRRNFPWILSFSVLLALFHSLIFTWFSGNLITLGLAAIMLKMGLSLELKNFINPAIAIPSAISSLVHSLYGSIFVALSKIKSDE